jgi:serine phosphatase RsbU (regulator of sigma subunit)
MRLIIQENEALIGEVACESEAVYIGSHEGCRVRLPDDRIAAEQALIFRQGEDEWVIQQLDTRTELLVNNAIITDRTQLKNRDEIRIGEFLIRAMLFEPGAPASARPVSKTSVESLTRFVQFQLPPGALLKRADEPVTLQPEPLSRLGQANLHVSQCLAVEELMDKLLHFVLEMFTARRCWVGVRHVNYGPMEYQEGRLSTGQTADLPDLGDKLKPRVLDRGQFVLIPHVSPEEPWSALAGPLLGPEGPLGMVYLDTSDTNHRLGTAELDLLVAFLRLCAQHLDGMFRNAARQRAATMEGEVSVAHAIQVRLTPRKLPQWETLQWGAFREPGRERTGDIYDVVRLSNQTAAVMLAHTRAPGPLPSLLLSQAQAIFRAACMHLDPPHVCLRMMNHVMYDGQTGHELSCWVATVDPATGELRYALAGNMGAYVIGARGEERRLGPRPPLPPLSVEKVAPYATLTADIEPGETLALFTPGVTTARSRQEETFGEERFLNILCDGFGQLASSMMKEMLSDLQQFTEGGKQPDDITVLLAHRV